MSETLRVLIQGSVTVKNPLGTSAPQKMRSLEKSCSGVVTAIAGAARAIARDARAPSLRRRGDRLRGARDVDLALGVAHRLDRLGELGAELWSGSRITRVPWIGQSKWRASRAIIGFALQGRPKNVTSMPRA